MKKLMNLLENKNFSKALTVMLALCVVAFAGMTVKAIETDMVAETTVIEFTKMPETAVVAKEIEVEVVKENEAVEAIEVVEVIEETEIVEEETRPTVDEVPKYDQLQYTCEYGNIPLENGKKATVRSHGCGITCLSMVATYLLDDPSLTPDVLAEQFGRYNTIDGSAWSLFTDSAEVLGLGEVKQAFDWKAGGVEEALRNGAVVISNQRKDIFTGSGHYIVLTGITEDGKIMVNDPNSENWYKPYLKEGFENGFHYGDIAWTSACYWIYQPKN